jgi:OOP family OmpA-OmpF porin
MMKKFSRLLLTVTSLILVLGLALPMVASAHLLEKVDNFIVFMDQSGSMAYAKAQAGHQKFDKALATVNRLDKALPELGYDGGVVLFAPYKPLTNPAPFKTGSLDSAVAGVVPPFNSFTPMGDGLASVGTAIGKLSGTTALILFTDGVANKGTDPVAEARTLYSKYAPNLCIHVISYADTPEGKQTIEKIGALSSCSVVTTDADMDKFAKNVLYDATHVTHAPKPVAKPAPAPVPAPVAKEVITFNLLFGFDKSAITDEMIPVLEQAKMILEEDRGVDFVVSGHTDSTGPEDYNQGLSERRAASVNNWLVSNGIASSRLKVVGYGETRSKYDNGTKEGRKLNRRVELMSR